MESSNNDSIITVQSETTIDEIQQQQINDQIQHEIIEENKKYEGNVILGIDPAFKKTGIAIIDEQTGKYIDSFQISLKPDKKMTQTESDGYVANNAEKLIKSLFEKYNIEYTVIELQLGQFSADRVQLSFVQALPQNAKYIIQHSKLKLKHPQIKLIQADNPDSNKYNQNKHQGRQLAQQLYPQNPEIQKLTFDEYDSLLHAYYVFTNKNKILWHKKESLINDP